MFAISSLKFMSYHLVTFALYPKVMMRAAGSSSGRSALGHGSDAPWAVQVFSRSPFRPWTKTILAGDYQWLRSFGLGEEYELDDSICRIVKHFDAWRGHLG